MKRDSRIAGEKQFTVACLMESNGAFSMEEVSQVLVVFRLWSILPTKCVTKIPVSKHFRNPITVSTNFVRYSLLHV